MKLSRNIAVGLSLGALLLFSGCTAGVQCRAPDNSITYVQVFKSTSVMDPRIVKDQMDLFNEVTFNNNIKIDGNVVTAEKSKFGAIFTTSGLLAPWQMKLDANNDTFQVGETVYSCNKGLKELVQKLQEDINQRTAKKQNIE